MVATNDGGYAVVEAARHFFTADAPEILRSPVPSDSSAKGLKSAAVAYAEKLGLGGLENIRF